MSQAMGVRPSEVIFIRDELAAWSFDRAAFFFAQTIEEAVKARTKRVKNEASAQRAAQLVLNKYLYADDKQAPGRFRDPARG